MTLKDTLLGLVIIIVWGVNFVVIAWGLEGMPPLLMGGLRFLFVAVLGSFFVARPNIPLSWLLCYALTLGFAQFAFLFTAMAVGMPAGLASLVLQSQALFTFVFAFLLLREPVQGFQFLAICVAGAGLALIGLSNDSAEIGTTSMNLMGFSLTLIAAASWALGNIVARTISQRKYKANVNLVIWSAWVSAVPFFIASYVLEGPELMYSSLLDISWVSIASLLYLALIATILGYSLWTYLLSQYPAGQVAPLTLGVPVVGLASASIMLGEQVSHLQYLGIAIVMLGLSINMRIDKVIKKYVFSR